MIKRLTRHPRRLGRPSGVTLIETLAALAIVALVVPVFARAWSGAMDSAAWARAQIVSTTLAESRLAEIVANGEFSAALDGGDFGEEYEGYEWISELSDWIEDDRFRQIDVTVVWKRRNQEHETTVSTIIDASGE